MKPLQFLSLTTLLALSPALGACDSGSPLPALVELTPELESGALVVSEVRADEARRVIGSGDFDGDGRDDLLVSPAAILWGPLTEGAETTLDANRELPPESTTVADVDLDGVVEIITSGVVWSVSPQRDVRAFGIHDVGSHGRPAQVFVHDVLAGQLDRTSAEARAVEEICDRQVVVLGELPSHGESRGFQAKARIVELLVAECGFDVLLFEGPFYEFLGFQEAVNDGRAAPMQLDRAIGGIWLTRELAGWRRWLFDQTIGGALVVGGLDDQPSATSEYARATLPGLVASALTGVERRTCEASVARYLSWRYDDEHPLDETEQRHLTRCARLAAAELRPRNGAQGADLSHMMAENLASYFARQQGATGARERDEGHVPQLRVASTAPAEGQTRAPLLREPGSQGFVPERPLPARCVHRGSPDDESGPLSCAFAAEARSGQRRVIGRPDALCEGR